MPYFSGTGQSPLHVTLRAYSGVQDPGWDVQPSDPDFQQLYSALQGHTSTPLPDIVGYRGFEVQDDNALVTHTVAAGSNNGLEVLLLSSGLGSGNPGTVELIQELLCELVSLDFTTRALVSVMPSENRDLLSFLAHINSSVLFFSGRERGC